MRLRRQWITVVTVLALMLSASVASAAGKLGVLCLGGDTATTKQLIDTGELPLLRVGPTDSLIPYYKQRNPNGVVLCGLGGGAGVDYNQDPTQFALNRWNSYLWPELSKVSSSQKALIDYVGVSPNMNEPHTVAEAQWWNTYADTLLPLVANAGFKPLCFTSGVGGVPTDHSVLTAMLPMFRKAHQYGGGWAYHSYTIHYTKDVGTEIWYSLRYRQVYSFFAANAPDLMDMPVLLYEGGVDYLGNPVTDGWSYRGSREKYADWLYWFDLELQKDPYVPGVALFKIGDSPKSWPSFDLDPMVPWFIGYWETGDPSWPRPPTVLGMTVLSEDTMSDAVHTVCTSNTPIIYADPSEARTGGAIQVFKQANPDGIVVAGVRSSFAYGKDSATGAADKHWEAVWKVLGAMTPAQRAMIDYVDVTPGPVALDTSDKVSFYASYMNYLREKLQQNGMKCVIGTFAPNTIPVDQADWDAMSAYQDTWYNGRKAGAAMIYQTGVTTYAPGASAHAAGPLGYRPCYTYLLKYKPWMIGVPVIIMVGDGQDMKTIPDAVSRRPKDGLWQFKDWAKWFDAEANKDPDVLGIALFKVGAPHAYPSADLGNLADWFAGYIAERTAP